MKAPPQRPAIGMIVFGVVVGLVAGAILAVLLSVASLFFMNVVGAASNKSFELIVAALPLVLALAAGASLILPRVQQRFRTLRPFLQGLVCGTLLALLGVTATCTNMVRGGS